MKLSATAVAALSLSLASTATAQTPFTDPANLRGERVSPRTGREIPLQEGTLGLEQLLRRLNTRASLMLIVAHPDDEDGGMLTLYSRGLGARVADLSLTRGEGGQNAVTGDFEDALGLIRTQELLSADRYTGVDQFFGTEVDFGFSKTKEEAFAKWTHERVLYDAVRAVRIYRPLVIAAVFIGGVTDGHGQHQVSGEIAQEVFKAAGDPNVFPELTAQGILPWQPLKMYARVPTQSITPGGLFDYATNQYAPARFTNYVTGEVTTTPPSVDVVVHEGETDPLLTNAAANPEDLRDRQADPNARLSYVQFARIGLGLQKTQVGPGVRLAAPGVFDIGYHLYGSMLPHRPEHEQSFFDGIDTTTGGIAQFAPDAPEVHESVERFAQTLQRAAANFKPDRPGDSAMDLMKALREAEMCLQIAGRTPLDRLEKANVLHELRVKRVQINDALALALGLQIEALAGAVKVSEGSDVKVTTRLLEHSSVTLPEVHWSLTNAGQESSPPVRSFNTEGLFPAGSPATQREEVQGAFTDTLTRPYFHRTSIEQPVYQLSDPQLRLAPQSPPALVSWVDLTLGPTSLRIGHLVDEGTQPITVVPPLNVTLSTGAQVLPNDHPSCTLSVFTSPPAVHQTIVSPYGWATTAEPQTTIEPGRATYLLRAPVQRSTATVQVKAFLRTEKTYAEGYRPVGYPGIPYTNYYTPATDRIVPVDLNLPAKRRIAYLQGTGDQVPEALASVNLPVTLLRVADLTPEHLAHFDTVILGVRTYNAHPELHGAPTEALLDFARRGGNVVVQYQTAEFTGADAPYPLTLGNAEKVVDETTPVRLLDPSSPPLTTPNRITEADFNGWIEERGHGFLHTWDPHYTALTETHDPGGPETKPQTPQEGGLITTQIGRGHWTYCAFALYRQLPEAVPGAFRLFVNLLGLADQ